MIYDYDITVTIERVATDPRTGDPLPNPARHTIDGCAVAPRASTETEQLGTEVVVGLTLYAPFGADIRSSDTVYLPDDTEPWEVDGEPGHWRSPFTDWRPGCQIALARQRGA